MTAFIEVTAENKRYYINSDKILFIEEDINGGTVITLDSVTTDGYNNRVRFHAQEKYRYVKDIIYLSDK